MTLVEEAKSIQTKSKYKGYGYTEEEVQLFIEVLRGEVRKVQARKALKLNGVTSLYVWVAKMTTELYKNKRLAILEKERPKQTITHTISIDRPLMATQGMIHKDNVPKNEVHGTNPE